MAVQPSVVEYFNSRKRPAVDEPRKGPKASKVIVLDASETSQDTEKPTTIHNSLVKKLVFKSKEANNLTQKNISVSSSKSNQAKSKVTRPRPRRSQKDSSQLDIRTTLFKSCSKKVEGGNGVSSSDSVGVVPEPKDESPNETQNTERANLPTVPFLIRGALSPSKNKQLQPNSEEEKEVTVRNPNVPITTEASTSKSRKELNLGNIKAMMTKSSRLEEMKAALKRFNENKTKLMDSVKPTLDDSEQIEITVPVPASPMKTPKKLDRGAASPQFKLNPTNLFASPPTPVPASPLKSPFKSPAFQRYQALVTEGRPALVLPFKYRALAETFRCVDTVASMLHNRKETITLSKLRPGVQEISRKNLTEYDLGQIKTVFPDAFEFSIEKMRSLGSAEKYELVLTPQLEEFTKDEVVSSDDKHLMMSPSVLLARRRFLYNALLELTKDHHEEFLSSLDPPMKISRARLTRWHPEFCVDEVPDVLSEPLPQPPNIEKVASAKDVLERARNLFVVNPRMERALQRLSEKAPTLTPVTSVTALPTLNKPALHGVPASLLEKVRAKQAARALEAMTRTPSQAKEAVRLTRLPEIARILRNLFVAEKKSVLPRELVLQKMADSYREGLSHSELDDHLVLLAEKTPGWILFCTLRKTDFVKLSRNADMSKVMTRLETLAEEKCL
ncbi:DNA replication factor Cdt1 [Macrosteles quadrilineatus]|uniref:DNA replication factor Cdt1 n=1 Tax=Macrosteles quadrilineatus TaxID=74068 RepID=UPI0023E28EF1|nr:DNA replication factor Cdt1 [Macrosteles quadrilineatus]